MTVTAQNNHDSAPLHYFIAVVAAMAIYASLFFLFDQNVNLKVGNKNLSESFSEITMLPIEKNPKYAWQKNLIATLELLDPTIMSLPNPNYGFSKVRNLEYEPPVKLINSSEFKVNLISSRDPVPVPVTKSAAPLTDILGPRYEQQSVEMPPLNQPISKLNPYIYWTTLDGQIIDALTQPSLDLTESSGEETQLSGPTKVLITKQNQILRFRLFESCGRLEMDQAALRHVRQYFAKVQSKSVNDGILTFQDRQILVGHWRFLPGIEELGELRNERLLQESIRPQTIPF